MNKKKNAIIQIKQTSKKLSDSFMNRTRLIPTNARFRQPRSLVSRKKTSAPNGEYDIQLLSSLSLSTNASKPSDRTRSALVGIDAISAFISTLVNRALTFDFTSNSLQQTITTKHHYEKG